MNGCILYKVMFKKWLCKQINKDFSTYMFIVFLVLILSFVYPSLITCVFFKRWVGVILIARAIHLAIHGSDSATPKVLCFV